VYYGLTLVILTTIIMTRPTANPSPVPELGAAFLDQLRALLDARFEELVVANGEPNSITRRDFQSREFRDMGCHHMPDRYGTSDRFLYTLEYDDGRRVFVVTGKVATDNPYELDHAGAGGLDLRPELTVVFMYDGKGTITEISLRDSNTNTHTGEAGNPDFLLGHIERSLGTEVIEESVG